jgi:hypothetical protein
MLLAGSRWIVLVPPEPCAPNSSLEALPDLAHRRSIPLDDVIRERLCLGRKERSSRLRRHGQDRAALARPLAQWVDLPGLFAQVDGNRTNSSTVRTRPRREHSRKPDQVYLRIERLALGPYLELFVRQS